jgi:hypothetical protein
MMRTAFLFLTLLISATSPCSALTQEAADFLKTAGLDPASPDVIAADKDGTIQTTFRGDPVTFSLEKLATEKKTNAVRAFVASRRVARELRTNFKSYRLPAAGGIPDYDGTYLTPAERLLMADKIVEPR